MNCSRTVLVFALIISLIFLVGGVVHAKTHPGPDLKKDSMLVMPDALKRVPIPLQVSAWAAFKELMDRGLVVDPTLAMLSGVRNPFCVKEMSVVITKDTNQIEFYVDSLCAGPNPDTLIDTIERADSNSTSDPIDEMRVRVIGSQLKPTKFNWPQELSLDNASIRAIYRIVFADKGDLGMHELFGSFDANELLILDSTRAVIMR